MASKTTTNSTIKSLNSLNKIALTNKIRNINTKIIININTKININSTPLINKINKEIIVNRRYNVSILKEDCLIIKIRSGLDRSTHKNKVNTLGIVEFIAKIINRKISTSLFRTPKL